ncbi:Uncharacterised protein [Mycobacteroides abscessus subsp. abscessus]|nr:Uncharacterised protein [Mycobacteroides abscessus subsp. abscessus]
MLGPITMASYRFPKNHIAIPNTVKYISIRRPIGSYSQERGPIRPKVVEIWPAAGFRFRWWGR